MVTSRRSFLLGLGAAGLTLAAPAVIRTPGLLMPIKPPLVIDPSYTEPELFIFRTSIPKRSWRAYTVTGMLGEGRALTVEVI